MTSTGELNGYYEDDFEEKRLIIKDLLENDKIDYKSLDILMDGILHKFCSSQKMANGKYFWYSWS